MGTPYRIRGLATRVCNAIRLFGSPLIQFVGGIGAGLTLTNGKFPLIVAGVSMIAVIKRMPIINVGLSLGASISLVTQSQSPT